MKTMLLMLVAVGSAVLCRAEGGNVQGTPTKLRGGTANAVPRYDTTGSIRPGIITDDTHLVNINGLFSSTRTAIGTVGNGAADGVWASTIIPVSSSFETVISSFGGSMVISTMVLTSLPTISTTTVPGGSVGITDGTFLVISGTSTESRVVFLSSGTLAGTQLKLNAASRTVTRGSKLSLVFDSVLSLWVETGFTQ